MNPNSELRTHRRMQVFYTLLVFVFAVFVARLFFLQVLRNDFYADLASQSQLKQFEIPAERGSLYAYDGQEIVPLVLNETRYKIVADPKLVSDVNNTAQKLAAIIAVSEPTLLDLLKTDSRYVILANKQTKEVKQKVEELELPGVFAHEKVPLRVYVQGQLAAQVIGFVNDAGVGNYGVEQALNEQLDGTTGRVKALTDQNNVPLLASGDNVLVDPVNGDDVVLTLDIAMQRQAEALLVEGLKRAQSESGSIVILEAGTGAVKAMASYPTYNPESYAQVEDSRIFINPAVSMSLEPGSITKVLTVAAAMDSGAVGPDQTYADPGFVRVDDAMIKNVAGGATDNTSVSHILEHSLNTGATWLLKQMGGGELNEQGRKTWHDYMVNHYRLGRVTDIEQGIGSEDPGVIPDPSEGFGLNVRYANTSFGQGFTATPIQMASATAAVVNGGTYYKPTLVAGTRNSDGSINKQAPVVVSSSVVSDSTSEAVRTFMTRVVARNMPRLQREGYVIGGKTGTAEIANPEGGYYKDKFNGTYVGFVGGDVAHYVIMIRVDEPKIPGFAGSAAAAPIFYDVVNMLIDNFAVPRLKS